MVELKDIGLPPTMQRAMARQAEAADVIAEHPVALQLRHLQILAEIAVEKNSTIVFPAQFLDRCSNCNASSPTRTRTH